MDKAFEIESEAPAPLAEYRSILVALDSSDHANRGLADALALARAWGSRITGTHVYAAQMHDLRFRQMEGGLPEQFRDEQELEHQRDVHDDLITRGLSIITDSYLDRAEERCAGEGIDFDRRPLEGKNYRALVDEANSGAYDLVVMGALGLGAVAGSRLGTVCGRVMRRTTIDTLVIRNTDRAINAGPIVVALDGSRQAYGGLLTALALAGLWGVKVHAVAAFDPYYHYVVFNRIADVLSEEAGKVFRFREQEQLHEDIIDSGLAKIYQGHLDVAESIATDHGVAFESRLLDGKPHDAIGKYIAAISPSLLIVGKRGIHADGGLDIGGNAESLARDAACAVLLSEREYRPRVEVVAEITTSWTNEAQQQLDKTPVFVRDMARMAIMRFAQERGHTVITAHLVEEATAQLMPGHAAERVAKLGALKTDMDGPAAARPMDWSEAAGTIRDAIEPEALRENIGLRAEKKARHDGCRRVEAGHVGAFLEPSGTSLHWTADALARVSRIPEGMMRKSTRERTETLARAEGLSEITLEIVETAIAAAQEAMASTGGGDGQATCPIAHHRAPAPDRTSQPDTENWSPQALDRLLGVPEGYCRDMTIKAVNAVAAGQGISDIDEDLVEAVMATFEAGSKAVHPSLPWDDAAHARVDRAPRTVRGMLIKEIEAWARRNGRTRVDEAAVDKVKDDWRQGGTFHLDPDDPRNR